MVIERCEWSTSAPAAQQHERDAEQDDQASEFAA
jgi:hypothetical protein